MLTAVADDGTYDLDISKVLKRAELKWAAEHSDERKLTRGSITSIWPGGIDEFRQVVIVERYLNLLHEEDRILNRFGSHIRQAQQASRRETQMEGMKGAIASYARDLLSDRLDRPLALLFFRTLLERSESAARVELEAGLLHARRRAIPYFQRAVMPMGWKKTTPEVLYASVIGIVDGLLFEWTTQRGTDAESPERLAYNATLALCNGFSQAERSSSVRSKPSVQRRRRGATREGRSSNAAKIVRSVRNERTD